MNKIAFYILAFFYIPAFVTAQYPPISKLLYGVAYYDEYMRYYRLDKDFS